MFAVAASWLVRKHRLCRWCHRPRRRQSATLNIDINHNKTTNNAQTVGMLLDRFHSTVTLQPALFYLLCVCVLSALNRCVHASCWSGLEAPLVQWTLWSWSILIKQNNAVLFELNSEVTMYTNWCYYPFRLILSFYVQTLHNILIVYSWHDMLQTHGCMSTSNQQKKSCFQSLTSALTANWFATVLCFFCNLC